MRKELEEKLARRWPSWFGLAGDPVSNPMARGFQHGDGWFSVLWRLCLDLEPLVAELEKETGERFEVLQVKQKLGTVAGQFPRKRRFVHVAEAKGGTAGSFRVRDHTPTGTVQRATQQWETSLPRHFHD
jgi:hypothetical protein